MNNNINEVISGLYEDLIKLRYPGIAHEDINHFKESILSENNRLQLLSWLLIKSYKYVDQTCDISPTDECRLVECYANMGISNNKEALLGRESVEDQIETLINLRTFISAVLMQGGKFLQNPTESAWEIVQKYTEKINDEMSDFSHLISGITTKEAKDFIKSVKASKQNNISDTKIEDNANVNEKTQDYVKDIVEQNEVLTSEVIDNFCGTFEDVNQLEIPNIPVSGVNLDSQIDNINNQFTKLNKTFKSRMDLINSQLPSVSCFQEPTLNQTVQNIAVALEKLPQINENQD